jgi:hypothetical protein
MANITKLGGGGGFGGPKKVFRVYVGKLFSRPPLIHINWSCHPYRFNSIRRVIQCLLSSTLMLLYIIDLPLLVNANLISTSSSLNIYAINTNGMGSALKLDSLCNSIKLRSPHVFVFSETKSSTKQAGKILPRLSGYTIIENEGIATCRTPKWGVIMGIDSRIPFKTDKLLIPTILKGRVAAADLIIPTDYGGGIPHRVIGVYAPVRNSGQDHYSITAFWKEVM